MHYFRRVRVAPLPARPHARSPPHSRSGPRNVCARAAVRCPQTRRHTHTHNTQHTATKHSACLCACRAGQTMRTAGVAGRACLYTKADARARAPRARKNCTPLRRWCLSAAAPGGVCRCGADLNFFLMLANRSISRIECGVTPLWSQPRTQANALAAREYTLASNLRKALPAHSNVITHRSYSEQRGRQSCNQLLRDPRRRTRRQAR
jgi:hypothetical protein